MSDTATEEPGAALQEKVDRFLETLDGSERDVVGHIFTAAATAPREEVADDEDVSAHWWQNCIPYTTCYYACVAGRRAGGASWGSAALDCGDICRRQHPGCG